MRGSEESACDTSSERGQGPEMDVTEWLNETTKTLLHRSDMNQLIMNYLVMGLFCHLL